jgi:hypothetical protein
LRLYIRSILETCIKQPEESAVAEDSIHTGHFADFSSTSVLHKAAGYLNCLVKEAIEIRLNTRNLDRDGGFILNWAWYPVTKMLYSQKAGAGTVCT